MGAIAQPGRPLRIPAATWNRLLDMAQRSANELGAGPEAALEESTGIVLVKNNSGADVDRFGVLGIDGVVFTPSDNLVEFKRQVAIKGITPAAATHEGTFVVLAEPLKSGAVGRAYAAGVCHVQIDVTDAAHTRADVKDSDRAKLASKSDDEGSARILWKESGTGTKWATVMLGAGGAGGDALPVPTAKYQVLSVTAYTSPTVYTLAFDWVRAH
jgi:hypothetical protein